MQKNQKYKKSTVVWNVYLGFGSVNVVLGIRDTVFDIQDSGFCIWEGVCSIRDSVFSVSLSCICQNLIMQVVFLRRAQSQPEGP